MVEDNGRASWERRRDADKQAEWRADISARLASIDKWRPDITAKVEAIHADQQERKRRREIIVGFFVVSGSVFKWVGGLVATLIVAWQIVVTIVKSAGNG